MVQRKQRHANVRINCSHRILYTFPSFRYIKSTFKINLALVSYSNGKSDFRLQWQKRALLFCTASTQLWSPDCSMRGAHVPLNAGRLDPQASRILVPGSHSPPATNLIKLVWEGAWTSALLNAPCFISMCSQGWGPLCLSPCRLL